MHDRDRLERLQELVGRLERLPSSADRDWMLEEIRGRAVDIDTGVKPASLRTLPRGEADAERRAVSTPSAPAPRRTPAAAKPPRRRTPAVRREPRVLYVDAPAPRSQRAPVARERSVNLLEDGHVLCLDEAPAARTCRPWAHGLRG